MKRGAPQEFDCPTCGQPAGQPCVNGWGRRCHYAHLARKRLIPGWPGADTPGGTDG